MRTMRTLLFACALVCIAGVSVATAGDKSSTAPKVCPVFSGPRWVISASNTGTKYTLETSGGYSCSNAATWAKRLVAKSLPSSKQNVHYKISGVPGLACEASPDRHRHAFTGSCEKPVKGSLTMIGFDWSESIF